MVRLKFTKHKYIKDDPFMDLPLKTDSQWRRRTSCIAPYKSTQRERMFLADLHSWSLEYIYENTNLVEVFCASTPTLWLGGDVLVWSISIHYSLLEREGKAHAFTWNSETGIKNLKPETLRSPSTHVPHMPLVPHLKKSLMTPTSSPCDLSAPGTYDDKTVYPSLTGTQKLGTKS